MFSEVQISKTLSYWLRHRPDAAGLVLSPEGWADIDAVLAAFLNEKTAVDWELLLQVVETSDKTRFQLSADGGRIRARQGHTIEVEADWAKAKPPEQLFHGTVDRFWDSIRTEGLKPGKRHHVHLSPDVATAERVGRRRGTPVVLRIDAQGLASEGTEFFLTGNGVWLVDHVPAAYLSRM